ncbi:MAG: MFS transporter [Actinomycetota bacterium]
MLERLSEKVGFIKNRHYLLFSVSFGKFLFGFYSTAIGSLLVPIGNEFNINIRTQSIIFPANYVGQLIVILIAGFIADKFGKKLVQLSSLVLFSVVAVFFNFVDTYVILLILFFFLGIFGSAVNILTDATVSETFSKKKGIYLNITHIYFGLGALAQPLFFNYVYAKTGDFRTIYFVLFLFSIFILLLLIPVKYHTSKDSSIKLGVILKIFKNKGYLLLCIFFCLAVGGQFTFSHWIPTLFQKNLNISSELSNYSLSLFWVAITLGRVVSAILSRKFSEETLIRFQSASLFVLILMSAFFNNYLLLAIDYLVVGFLVGGLVPLIVAYTSKIYSKYLGTRLGILYAFAAIGTFLVPSIVGLFGDVVEIYKVISSVSVFFGIIAFYFFRTPDNKKFDS